MNGALEAGRKVYRQMEMYVGVGPFIAEVMGVMSIFVWSKVK